MRWVTPLLVLLALGTVVVLLLQGEGAREEASAPAGRDAEREPGSGPLLQGARGGGAAARGSHARRTAALRIDVLRDGAPAAAELTLSRLHEVGQSCLLPQVLLEAARAPQAEARVREHAPRTGTTDAQGVLTFEGLEPGRYVVQAVGEGGARGLAVRRLAAGEHDRVAVSLLPAGHALEGSVRYTDGAPAGVQVSAWASRRAASDGSWQPLGPPDAEGAVDAQGAFRLPGLGAGAYELRVRLGDGLVLWPRPVLVPRATPLHLVAPRPGPLRPGRVVDALTRQPVPGAVVWTYLLETGVPSTLMHVVECDGAGRFALHLPDTGSTTCWAEAAGFGEGSLVWDPLQGETELLVPLLPRGRVAGRVTSAADGAPVAGAQVLWIRSGDWLAPRSTLTDASGRYELSGIPAGEQQVTVLGGGWGIVGYARGSPAALASAQQVRVPAGGTVEADLVVEPAGRLHGRALLPDGRPAAGASVRLAQLVRAEGGDLARTPLTTLFAPVSAEADGTFVLTDLPLGARCCVEADADGHPTAGSAWAVVAAGDGPGGGAGTGEEVLVQFAAGRRVHVTVLEGASLAPVPGAHVRVEWTDPTEQAHRSAVQTTDERGVALCPAAPTTTGSVRAWLLGERYGAQAEVALPPGGDARVEVRLQGATAVRGRALLPDGRPAIAVLVVARHVDSEQKGTTTTDAAGEFTLWGLEAGRQIVGVATSEDALPLEPVVVEAPAQGVVLRAPARTEAARPTPWVLRVRALLPDGSPAPAFEARVVAAQESRALATARANAADGCARVVVPREAAEKAEGPLRVEVHGATSLEGTPLEVTAGSAPTSLDAGEVEVRLVAGVRLEGRVVDEQGRGVVGATVQLVRTDAPAEEVPVPGPATSRTTTDRAGRFVGTGLAPGRYRVAAAPTETLGGASVDDVTAGGAPLTLVMRPSPFATVRVVGPRGQPLPGLRVDLLLPRALDGGADWQFVRTDESGHARLRLLADVPSYRLDVETDLPDGVQPLRLSGWTPAQEVLRLRAVRRVQGRVVDARGAPLAGVLVLLTQDAAPPREERTVARSGPDGRFEADLPGDEHDTTEVWLSAGAPGEADAEGADPWGEIVDLDQVEVLPDRPAAEQPAPVRDWRRVVPGREVLLTADAGAAWTVRVAGASAAADGVRARLLAQPSDKGPWTALRDLVPEPGGGAVYRFQHLDPRRRYAFEWSDGARCVWAELPAGQPEVDLAPQPARTLRGRVLGAALGRSLSIGAVNARDHVVVGRTNLEGVFELRGLFDGPYRVSVGGDEEASVEVQAGDRVELRAPR